MAEEDTNQILVAINGVKDDIKGIKADIAQVQKTVDSHTGQIERIVRVIAGPMPNAINNIEDALNRDKTDFFAKAKAKVRA